MSISELDKVKIELCEALGLDPQMVSTIELRVEPDKEVKVTVTQYVGKSEYSDMCSVIKRYSLVERPKSAASLNKYEKMAVEVGIAPRLASLQTDSGRMLADYAKAVRIDALKEAAALFPDGDVPVWYKHARWSIQKLVEW